MAPDRTRGQTLSRRSGMVSRRRGVRDFAARRKEHRYRVPQTVSSRHFGGGLDRVDDAWPAHVGPCTSCAGSVQRVWRVKAEDPPGRS
jgi:hypothetical protein